MTARVAPGLDDKVAALRDGRSYPRPVARVEAVETHMSWVFLTPAHAWKLKKPVRLDEQDFGTLQARRFFCEEELRLNRRLAPRVYLRVVPLRMAPDGRLRVGGPGGVDADGPPRGEGKRDGEDQRGCEGEDQRGCEGEDQGGCTGEGEGEGEVVDWLVQMRRLPAASMLDAQLAARTATPEQLRRVAARLCAFYRGLPPAPLDAGELRALLLGHVGDAERDLCRPEGGLPPARVRACCAGLRRFLLASDALLARRVREGRVVEGHGDLRPEHVYLGEPLAVIDCLEFSARLRMQDAADEVGFLALECERAGAAALAGVLLQAYRDGSGDEVPVPLVHAYQALRACVRARLAVRHLFEPGADAAKWRHRARQYLALAVRHLRRVG